VVHILCIVQFCLAGIASAAQIDNVRATVYAWRNSWQDRDINRYMYFYSPNFRLQGLDYKAWMQKKTEHFKISGDIQVEIIDLAVFIESENAVVRFVQRYHDAKYSDVGEKTLTLVTSNGKWKIVSEAWKPLVTPIRKTKEMAPRSIPRDLSSVSIATDKPRQDSKTNSISRDSIIIKSIKYKPKKDRENVFIASNTFFIPKILTFEGDRPRIVIDIKPVSSWSGRYSTPVKGNLIRQIRTHLEPDTKNLRVVLDLNPSENYYVNQIYYEKKKVYCIEVK
jgi:ketosteroid isomerase-like protein